MMIDDPPEVIDGDEERLVGLQEGAPLPGLFSRRREGLSYVPRACGDDPQGRRMKWAGEI
jgi:hypothetical protein